MAEEKKKRVLGSAAHLTSPVQKLEHPILHTIATEIIADDVRFIPQYSDEEASVVDLIANITGRPIASGETVVVDCGFKMTLPAGYKINIIGNTEKLVSGVIVTGFKLEEGRVKVNITNLSRDTVWIGEGKFAKMSIDPVYAFRWKNG